MQKHTDISYPPPLIKALQNGAKKIQYKNGEQREVAVGKTPKNSAVSGNDNNEKRFKLYRSFYLFLTRISPTVMICSDP